ncbi:hypothetical protein LG651_04470 [Tamlana sp. 62-3]|uniref:ATP synthase F1 complex delta/epsilon subunit N-terminal domain-containing protein n=1 Tax=Neotamlana sargassicola TaxID=2883125 RepID=A0A9X1I427_9FLAO|nr:hypothetical protein [Tamlana sargassicola]MCB4807495.1 hypothetical protein [Tamlana sargassicola]
MYLEIVSPEATLFSSEVDSVVVPGINGEFELLKGHAPIVSLLKEGTVKIRTHSQSHLELDDLHGSVVPHKDDKKLLTLAINSGTLEINNDKVIVLAD